MRHSKSLFTAFLLVLALVAVPALADDAAPAALDFDALQGAEMKAGENCNQRTCGKNQFCCNFSCSICAPIGGACTQQVCDPIAISFVDTLAQAESSPAEVTEAETVEAEAAPAPELPLFAPEPEDQLRLGGQCNQTVCGQGQFCCNWSCSVCAPLGGACLDVYCPPVS